MPKQTKSSNNTALKGFALTLVILILAVCVMAAMTEGFTNWNPYGWFDKEPAVEQQPDGEETGEESAPIDTTITNSEHVMLAMSMATTAAEDGYTKSVTLTATVMPEDAPDKSVDWSIAWNEAPTYGDNPVTDYVTVTPQSDGSNVATVTCLQPFGTDTIIVTVTTRKGGYTASASITYAGLPTTVSLNTEGYSSEYDSAWGVDIFNLECGSTHEFSVVLDNGFHSIGENFTPNYEITIGAQGSVNIYEQTDVGNTTTAKTLTEINATTKKSILDTIVDITIENGVVKINPIMALSAYNYIHRVDRYTRYNYTFAGYADSSKIPYITVTVQETNTGLTSTFAFRNMSAVQSVSLSESTIAF